MEQEHLAVGAFAMLTQELAQVGGPANLLALLAKASCDEVRHAEICRRLAVSALGAAHVPTRFRGLPQIPAHDGQLPEARMVLHAVEMCCIGETCTGVYLTSMHAQATHPTARAVLTALLEDEIDHGRVGWALLADASPKARNVVAAKLWPMLERSVGGVFASGLRAETTDHELSPFAYVSGEEAVAFYADTIREVVLPGFETLGIDTRPAVAALAARGRS